MEQTFIGCYVLCATDAFYARVILYARFEVNCKLGLHARARFIRDTRAESRPYDGLVHAFCPPVAVG